MADMKGVEIMKITINEKAVSWYKNELYLEDGASIRFFARYGGQSPLHKGFSLGLSTNDTPYEAGAEQTADGITFFIEENDLWFFDEHDLVIGYNEKLEEPEYRYEKLSS